MFSSLICHLFFRLSSCIPLALSLSFCSMHYSFFFFKENENKSFTFMSLLLLWSSICILSEIKLLFGAQKKNYFLVVNQHLQFPPRSSKSHHPPPPPPPPPSASCVLQVFFCEACVGDDIDAGFNNKKVANFLCSNKLHGIEVKVQLKSLCFWQIKLSFLFSQENKRPTEGVRCGVFHQFVPDTACFLYECRSWLRLGERETFTVFTWKASDAMPLINLLWEKSGNRMFYLNFITLDANVSLLAKIYFYVFLNTVLQLLYAKPFMEVLASGTFSDSLSHCDLLLCQGESCYRVGGTICYLLLIVPFKNVKPYH